jgi:hypothetical protein
VRCPVLRLLCLPAWQGPRLRSSKLELLPFAAWSGLVEGQLQLLLEALPVLENHVCDCVCALVQAWVQHDYFCWGGWPACCTCPQFVGHALVHLQKVNDPFVQGVNL